MDPHVKTLRCFVTVAEEQSFSAAAKRMHMTQPALSAQIKALETSLGLELFVRTTRRVDLTPQGRSLLTAARRVVEHGDQFSRTAGTLKRSKEKRLSIGAAFYTIDIPERIRLIDGFIAAFPDIDVEVDARWQMDLLRDLLAGHLDCVLLIGVKMARDGFRKLTESEEPTELLYPDHLQQLVIRREPVHLMVPAELPMAKRNSVPLEALEGQRVVMFSADHGGPVFDPPCARLEEAGAEIVIPPEAHGIGVERYGRQFRLPAVSLGWFNTGGGEGAPMVERPLEGLSMETSLTLVRNPDVNTPLIEAFWDFAKSQFALGSHLHETG